METISFILLMESVVVIAIAIVAVYTLIKVKKQKKEISNLYRIIDDSETHIHNRITKEALSIYSILDKLEIKLK